jgi:hypothetical protein
VQIMRRWCYAFAVVSLWLSSGAALHAQTLYEWREPGGTVVYSQLRPEDGSSVRTLVLRDLSGPSRTTALRVAVQSAPASLSARRALAVADGRVDRAIDRLQRAERAVRAGQEPLPGERQHLVNGHSRLTRAYFDRISLLENDVTQARAELQAAYAERDAVLP